MNMYKKEFCAQIECDIYYKPNNDVLECAINKYQDKKNKEDKEDKKDKKDKEDKEDKEFRIKDLYTSKYKNALRKIFTDKIPDRNSRKVIEEYIDANYNSDDYTMYNDIKKIIIRNKIQMSENNVNTITKYLQSMNNLYPSFYLDIGRPQNDITTLMGKHFKLNKFQIHSIDINLRDGKKIPYNDSSFDLITCLMVLHKISLENIDSIISEINRVIKPGGILILREHN